MHPAKAFAALKAGAALQAYEFNRRALRDNDVLIDILFCGVCHSDIHMARGEWGDNPNFPMVPGHEIVGRVAAMGPQVQGFAKGDLVGVGCFVDSCRVCPECQAGQEQYCDEGPTNTYGGKDRHDDITQGGYSDKIVVRQEFVLKIPSSLPLAATAPLLCAGITTYSPLKHWNVRAGQNVAVVGLGGLGHMAVKFAKAFGASVTVLSTSPAKEGDARKLGADHFLNTRDAKVFKQAANRFDFILDTVAAPHDVNRYLGLLALNGSLVMVGLPEEAFQVSAFSLVRRRRSLAGSLVGGIAQTQEMLDFCGEHGITSDIELIPIQKINEAFDRTVKGDVKYRFVIDMKSLG